MWDMCKLWVIRFRRKTYEQFMRAAGHQRASDPESGYVTAAWCGFLSTSWLQIWCTVLQSHTLVLELLLCSLLFFLQTNPALSLVCTFPPKKASTTNSREMRASSDCYWCFQIIKHVLYVGSETRSCVWYEWLCFTDSLQTADRLRLLSLCCWNIILLVCFQSSCPPETLLSDCW